MFKWIKKLMCEHTYKYYSVGENTRGRPRQGLYEYNHDFSRGWLKATWQQWDYTLVVYQVCKKCHKRKEVHEVFGENCSQEADELVEKLNNL